MNAKEIYNLKPIFIKKDFWELKGCYANLLPEIEEFNCEMMDLNTRIETKYYVDYCFDGRRTWTLASIWFDSTPIMIIQRAGREGDDHYNRFITNVEGFHKMVKYIRSLIVDELDENCLSYLTSIPKAFR